MPELCLDSKYGGGILQAARQTMTASLCLDSKYGGGILAGRKPLIMPLLQAKCGLPELDLLGQILGFRLLGG